MNRNSNVTFIEDLPNLDEMEPQPQNENDEKFQKYIRGSFRMDPSSGMGGGINGSAPVASQTRTYQPQPRTREYQNKRQNFTSNEDEISCSCASCPFCMENTNSMSKTQTYINCIDIVKHVQECPICSKFYNNDKTVYILVIVVLCVICLLLLKKVLDV